MYSFDHDLGHFVSIGPGTVSEDGTVITSNHGVGVVKAGWHCCGYPQGTGTPNHCPECTKCTGALCAPEALCNHCGTTASGTACDGNGSCLMGKALIPKICDQLDVVITNRHTIPESDPLVTEKLQCGADTCFAGMREDLTEVTHSCDNISMAGARISEETTYVSSGGCPSLPSEHRPTTCVLTPGNQLFSLALGRSPCEDTHAFCPPASILPVGTCTIIGTQTYFVDDCPATVRKVIYTFGKSPDGGCTGIVQ